MTVVIGDIPSGWDKEGKEEEDQSTELRRLLPGTETQEATRTPNVENPKLPADAEDAVRLLSSLWRDAKGYGEILGYRNDSGSSSWIALPADESSIRDAVAWGCSRNDMGFNVSLGVNPRVRCRGGNDEVEFVVGLFADVDGVALATLDARLDDLRNAGCPPSAVVDSGHGRHLYWLLDHPTRYRDLPCDLNRRLRSLLGCDHAVDRARRARMPGTWNRKLPDQPVLCRLILLDENRRYSPQGIAEVLDGLGVPSIPLEAEFEGRTELLPSPPSFVPPAGPPPPLPVGLWPRERMLIETGDFAAAGHDSKSEGDQAIALALVRCGWDDQQIAALFAHYAIGAKFRGKRTQGTKYLSKTLFKARVFERALNPPVSATATVRRVSVVTDVRVGRGRRRVVELSLEVRDGEFAGRRLATVVDLDEQEGGDGRAVSDWLALRGQDAKVELVRRHGADGTWVHVVGIEPTDTRRKEQE